MKICVAQIKPTKADILENIDKHKKLIKLALDEQADAIFFPELSLTGYEPDIAKDLATNQEDAIFDEFQHISNTDIIIIGVGMPTKSDAGILISMIIFQPNLPRQTYSKQHLHSDEFPFFVAGEKQIFLTFDDIKIAPAICYESLLTEHADEASKNGAVIYLASVAKSANGVEKAFKHYPEIAQKYSMTVLMANCIGKCDNFESAGNSAVWNNQGVLIVQLDAEHEGILVFDTETETTKIYLCK
jgi:predicted amidohydrolase